LKSALAFLARSDPPDYGRRLSRLRWRRGIPADAVLDVPGDEPAREAFAGAEVWLVVTEETALPGAMSSFPFPEPGRLLVPSTVAGSAAHTLRELETCEPGSVLPPQERIKPMDPADTMRPPAIGFRTADFPAAPGESVAGFLQRLLAGLDRRQRRPDFRAIRFEDASRGERPELTRHFPPGIRRLLDVSCGAGGSSAALRGRTKGLQVTGVEKDSESARLARGSLDRVIEGDAPGILEDLVREGEMFDAFLFADALERLEDPVGLLSRARTLAVPAATLVASVSNAGQLSLARDLVLGRFDPVPAGLTDAARLRWFTKASFAEALEEAGWRVVSIEPWAGTPAPLAAEFLERLSALPGLDRASLATSRWIAVAVPAAAPPAETRIMAGTAHPLTRSPAHPILRIAYLLESTEVSGGVKVVLQQAEALARRGHRVAVVSPGAQPGWFAMSRARFERSSFRESRELAQADIRIATFWTTVAPALNGALGPVFHLCQGYEGAFSFYAHRREEIEAAYGMPTRKLAISRALASKLDDLGFGPVENVGQSFDARDFSPRPESRTSSGAPAVLMVGPYEADVKGIGIGLEGLRIWRERGGVFRLRRISTQPLTADEKATALPDEYHHDLPPSRMLFAYHASDVFLGPNRPEEGFGLPALEALACGVPCLLSDTPGHREIAGEAAWYFPDGDPEGLAAALPDVVTREARARARVEGPRAASRFDTARVAANLEAAFERAVVGGGSGGSPSPLAGGPAPAV
jgi:glycosyltransferase involved in cell wall biosynthesis/SAM-dependent methyltransferase